MSFMDSDTFQQNKILHIFHFTIDLLSPDLKYSCSMSEQFGILVMLTVVITSFVDVESFDKSSSSSPLIFPVDTLLLTCPPLLSFLISTQLLCHFLSHLLGILQSSHYISTLTICCCNRILHYHSQFV